MVEGVWWRGCGGGGVVEGVWWRGCGGGSRVIKFTDADIDKEKFRCYFSYR